MTGPEHYAEGERHLKDAEGTFDRAGGMTLSARHVELAKAHFAAAAAWAALNPPQRK